MSDPLSAIYFQFYPILSTPAQAAGTVRVWAHIGVETLKRAYNIRPGKIITNVK